MSTEAQQELTRYQELREVLENLMLWQVKNVRVWNNGAYDQASMVIKRHDTALQEALAEPQPEPVATLWQQAPIRTTWGDEMMVASVAIDNDHTLSLYCERDQTPKVDAMFAQRKPLTNEEIENILPDDDTPMSLGEAFVKFTQAIEAAHGIKENS